MLKIRRKKLMNTKKQSVYLIALFFVSVFMGIGYSYLSSTLSINGYTTVYKNNWDVHFENLEIKSGSVSSGTSSIVENSTIVSYQVPLANTSDYYEFTVDVVNAGSIDAMIGSVVNNGITSAQSTYIEYSASYTSDREVKEKDLLPAGSSQKILVRVKYKGDIPNSSLPTEDQTLNLSLNINYIEAHNEVEVEKPVCKRAKTLHTDVCNIRTADNATAYHCMGAGYSVSQIFTYGSLGTSGTLTRGDAFDCDVNGDQKYDPDTERFYYVTSLENNADYAVLVYYNQVKNGEPKSKESDSSGMYDSSNNPSVNGPISLLPNLPTTSQWKNVSLTNTIRKIKDELGNEYGTINYSGYAARLLTSQELAGGCNKNFSELYNADGSSNIGKIDRNCQYILENSQFTREISDPDTVHPCFTLENIYSADNNKVFYLSGWGRAFSINNASNTWLSAKPVIEVSKDKINY